MAACNQLCCMPSVTPASSYVVLLTADAFIYVLDDKTWMRWI